MCECVNNIAMLANYSSLWEVFTAFFCSMLLDNIIGGIWTPEYKDNVTGLIKKMGILYVETLSNKLSEQIESNVAEISCHMHRRAIFMICFCLCLLVLTGAEANLGFTPVNETEILFWATIVGVFIVILGNWTFHTNGVTIAVCIVYILSFLCLCHCGHNLTITWKLLTDEKYAVGFVISFLVLPIMWQIVSCWIYSSLYYGKLREELYKEEIEYKKAIIGIRNMNMDIVPEKYKIRAAVDINRKKDPNEDISYESCDDILYDSIDALLENPVAMKILGSWLLHKVKLLFRKENNDDYDFINEQFNKIKQVQTPVSGLTHKDNVKSVEEELSSSTLEDALNSNDVSTHRKTKHGFTYMLLSAGIGIGYILSRIIKRNHDLTKY